VMDTASCVGACACCIEDSCLKAPTTIMARLKCSANKRKRRAAEEDFPTLSFDAFTGTGNATHVTRSDEIRCGAGSVPLDNSNCMVCVEGTYQSGDQCVSCPAGTYQDQTGTSTCSSCPEGTSTTGTGATASSLCIQVCQMEEVRYGVSDPPAGWIVKLGDPVTVRCNQGFQLGGQSIAVTQLKTCTDEPSCSRVQISTTSLNVLESSVLDLTCKITAADEPELCLFYKDSRQINATEPFSLEGGKYSCETSITMVQGSDEGSYSCSAVWSDDAQPEPSNDIDIRVMGLTFDSAGTVYSENSDHTFFCAATVPSDSAVIISWTRNGQPVGERLTSTSNPAIGVLNLETITSKDQGDYQCRATYLGIGTIVSDPATLTVLGFLETLADMDLTKGNSVRLHCKPTMGEISWSLNGSPLSSTSSSLTLENVGQENEGVYKCQAAYQGQVLSSSAKITVSDTGITQHPVDLTLQSGQQATLTCATNADSSFKWLMNEEEISAGVESTTKQSVLVTSPLTLRSHLQCIVSSGGKKYLSKKALVNLVGFKTMPKDSGLPVDGEVSLICSVLGDGLKQLVWIRSSDSTEVPSSKTESYNTGHATTNVLTTSQEGTYFCKATFEQDFIIESERATISPVRVDLSVETVALEADVTLTCSVTGAIKADLVFWTKDGELMFNDKSVSHVPGSVTSYSYLTLNSVLTSDVGEYRCAASILSDLTVYGSEPAPLKLLGFIDIVSDIVVKRGQLTEVVFSVRHQDGVKVSCDLSRGAVQISEGDHHGDVVRFRGEVISVGWEVKEIQYSCSVSYGADVVIKSDLAKIYIVDEPTLEVDSSRYVLIGEEAHFTLTANYISNVPAVHWKVNSLRTIQFSGSYTSSEYTSTLQWPVTHDIEVEATVHYADVGGYSIRRAVVLAYGVEGVTGPEKVHLGEGYNLTCSVATIDENTEITWYRADSPLLPHSTLYYDNKISSVLYLPEVEASDIGIYTCTAAFSDGKQSSGAFYVTQTSDCKLPSIENAVMDSSSDIISHLGELKVNCGDETIVIKCEHGSWDQTLVFCPASQTSWNVIGIVVVAVLLVVGVGAFFFYKKHTTRAVSPSLPESGADSVEMYKRQWRDHPEVINNPTAMENVNLDTQNHQQLERTMTQIST